MVAQQTTAQRIWSNPTGMLLVFAGASAEFAVHPNLDWLFFTGKLPSDPIARFLSTINTLAELLDLPPNARGQAARELRAVHTRLEESRGIKIPDVGYRDVLCMNSYYSIVGVPFTGARPLSRQEADEVVTELSSFGHEMGIPNLPTSFEELCQMRQARFAAYQPTRYTQHLLYAYRRSLGRVNYRLLLSLYPLLLEPELLRLLPIGVQPLAPILRRGLAPLCRTRLIHYVYRFGLPGPVRDVVQSWEYGYSTA